MPAQPERPTTLGNPRRPTALHRPWTRCRFRSPWSSSLPSGAGPTCSPASTTARKQNHGRPGRRCAPHRQRTCRNSRANLPRGQARRTPRPSWARRPSRAPHPARRARGRAPAAGPAPSPHARARPTPKPAEAAQCRRRGCGRGTARSTRGRGRSRLRRGAHGRPAGGSAPKHNAKLCGPSHPWHLAQPGASAGALPARRGQACRRSATAAGLRGPLRRSARLLPALTPRPPAEAVPASSPLLATTAPCHG
mmetsp:Transcript_139946/g.390149  ORF Transcript_139946/g.390149 Transcript_139946/m.390149 type:complete len:251 (-) Transcript_139946:614-1366(-)